VTNEYADFEAEFRLEVSKKISKSASMYLCWFKDELVALCEQAIDDETEQTSPSAVRMCLECLTESVHVLSSQQWLELACGAIGSNRGAAEE
jgi:hypothetical protein